MNTTATALPDDERNDRLRRYSPRTGPVDPHDPAQLMGVLYEAARETLHLAEYEPAALQARLTAAAVRADMRARDTLLGADGIRLDAFKAAHEAHGGKERG